MPTQSDIALLALNAKSSSYALTASFALNGGGGGGGTPGGSDTQVQFNDAGAFSGSGYFTFDKNNNIVSITGSTILSGSTLLFGLTNPSAPQVLTYDPSTGQVTYTASSAFGGGGSGPGGSDTDIQFNNAGNFSGSRNFRFDGINKVYLTGSISASSGTNTVGFFGTSSWAVSSSRATTSSFSISSSRATTSSFALTASYLPEGTYEITSSWANNASIALQANTSSLVSITNDGSTAGSFEIIFVNGTSPGETLYADNNTFYYNPATQTVTVQNLAGTASWAKSASYLPVGTYEITSSWAESASQALTASFTSTASYVTGSIFTSNNPALSASFALSSSRAITASFALTASFVATASYVTGSIFTNTNPALSASYALTASHALNSGGNAFPFNGNAVITGSLLVSGSNGGFSGITGSFTGSLTGSLFGTASWAQSASQALTASYINSSAFFTGSYTGSFTGIVSASNLSGSEFYVPRWGTTGYNLVSSNIWNSGSFINIGTSGDVISKVTITDGGETIIPFSISKTIGTQDAFKVVSSTSGTVVRINSSGGGNLLTIQSGAPLISRFIVGYNGSVYVSGSATGDGTGTTWSSSFSQIGELYFKSLTNNAQTNVLTYNTTTGQVFYTASSAIGGGGSGTGFPFSGSAVITGSLLVSQSGIIVTGSVDVTGSISASSGANTVGFFGTASWAQSASQALTASFVDNVFLQGGNSFGTTATLGTNDTQSLAFETSGSTRMIISSSGVVGIGTASVFNQTASLHVAGPTLLGGAVAGFSNFNSIPTQVSGAFGIRGNMFLYNAGTNATSSITWGTAGVSAWVTRNEGSSSFRFITGSTVLYHMSSSGLGILKDRNNATLDVNGNTILSGSLLVSGSSTLTGSMFVTGAISASFGTNTVGFFGTASWAESASQAISSSYALVAATANNIPTAVITSSTAGGSPYMYSLIPRAAGGVDDNVVQNSIFLGLDAGTSASVAGFSGASNSVFIGPYAGLSASAAGSSVFLGGNAGSGSTNAIASYFIGSFAGASSPGAFNSIIIGEYAGFAAISASNSTFLGPKAGERAVSASFSILLGQRAGQSFSTTQESIGKNNIIIGNNLTLPYNTQHYANIGGALFISGTYSNTSSNAQAALFSGSVSSSRVGINKWNPSYSLDVSGSVAFANLTSASQTHIVTIDTSSGQLFFTASSAIGGGGSGFPFSGSAVVTGSFLVSQSGIIVTGSINVTGSISASFGSNTVGFFGTSSWTQTASYALGLIYSTSSVIGNGLSSSFNINHGFSTRNLHITVYESSSNGETVYPDIRRINENTASIIFANPPSSSQYVVYISI